VAPHYFTRARVPWLASWKPPCPPSPKLSWCPHPPRRGAQLVPVHMSPSLSEGSPSIDPANRGSKRFEDTLHLSPAFVRLPCLTLSSPTRGQVAHTTALAASPCFCCSLGGDRGPWISDGASVLLPGRLAELCGDEQETSRNKMRVVFFSGRL
jgi:hypothetical protein